jgi:hypothetical protein
MHSPQMKLVAPIRRTKTSNWRDVYFAAVLESNERRALAKIQAAGKVLQDRLLELQSVANAPVDELRDLQSALTYLDILFTCIAENHPGTRMAAVA